MWIRGAQIGLGILVIILSIFALAFPAATFVSIVWILAIVLFFVGIERIIIGIVSPGRSRWANIGLGILVLIFGGIAMGYPVATAYIIIIFIGIAFLFSGFARIIEGFSSKYAGGQRAFLIGVGIFAVIISLGILASPIFGAQLTGVIISIGLLITGIQMITAGVQNQMPKFIKKFIGGVEQDVKSFGKQITADNPILEKTENFAILVYSGKTHKAFLEEFDKLTKESYKLSGISDPMGLPLIGINLKMAKIFFFQHLPSKQW